MDFLDDGDDDERRDSLPLSDTPSSADLSNASHSSETAELCERFASADPIGAERQEREHCEVFRQPALSEAVRPMPNSLPNFRQSYLMRVLGQQRSPALNPAHDPARIPQGTNSNQRLTARLSQ